VYYEHLDVQPLEQENGYKIFLFHTALSELKPHHLQEIDAHPLSLLPKGFDYYAGDIFIIKQLHSRRGTV
jgi:hypothetical protein